MKLSLTFPVIGLELFLIGGPWPHLSQRSTELSVFLNFSRVSVFPESEKVNCILHLP